MPAKSKAQQRFMGMVHAAQKGELDNPSSEVEKAADSMSDADAKDYASTKHKGLPNHVKKENMEKQLKEIIRQTYRESLRESVNEAKNTQPKNDWGKRLVEAIYNNVSAIDSLVNKDKRDVKDIMSNFGNPLINSIKETIKYNYKPHPIAGGHFNAKRKDNKYSEETYNKETIKQFKLQLAGLLKIAEFLNTKPSKAAVKKLVDMWRDIWNFRGGAEIALSGDMYNSIYESVNEAISHEAMGIASMTNTRKEAVQKFIDDNNLDAKEILTHVTKGKLPERIRFVQALVGTPNNSSFKWYVKNYANESVVTEGNTVIKTKDGKLHNYPNFKKNDVIKFLAKKGMKHVSDEKDLKSNNDFYIVESVNEGKKAFKINPPIGKAKYSISAHNGVSKHKDGSDFWDILIFKNKADLERRAKYFRGEKYIEESVVTEGRYDADLDKIEAVVKNATSFMNVGSELKKAGIKYDFTTSMIPMYMIKVSGNTIAICNKKYAAGAEREVNDIAIGLLN